MCLAAIAMRFTRSQSVLIAANRDEFHSRPDVAADWWPDHPTVLGGRDLATGGTWCAIDRRGRFALVMTPVTPPADLASASSPGRGQLVTDWVTGQSQPQDFLLNLRDAPRRWRDFKLVIGDVSNGLAGVSHQNGRFSDPWHLTAGLHCTDSGPDHEPWPKRRFLADRARVLLRSEPDNEDAWLTLLATREPAPASYGPAAYSTLRTPFTTGRRLGTRACTVIRVLATGDCHFTEHRFGPDAISLGSRTFSFTLSKPLSRTPTSPDNR